MGKRPRERVNVIYEDKGECPKCRIILTFDRTVNLRSSAKVIANNPFPGSPIAAAFYMQMCVGCWMCPERLKAKAVT